MWDPFASGLPALASPWASTDPFTQPAGATPAPAQRHHHQPLQQQQALRPAEQLQQAAVLVPQPATHQQRPAPVPNPFAAAVQKPPQQQPASMVPQQPRPQLQPQHLSSPLDRSGSAYVHPAGGRLAAAVAAAGRATSAGLASLQHQQASLPAAPPLAAAPQAAAPLPAAPAPSTAAPVVVPPQPPVQWLSRDPSCFQPVKRSQPPWPVRPDLDVAALKLSAAAPLVAAGVAPGTPVQALDASASSLRLLRCLLGPHVTAKWW